MEQIAFTDEALKFLEQVPNLSDEARLTTKQLSILTNRPMSTLEEARRLGGGIPFEKVGRSVRYRLGTVRKHLEEHQKERL